MTESNKTRDEKIHEIVCMIGEGQPPEALSSATHSIAKIVTEHTEALQKRVDAVLRVNPCEGVEGCTYGDTEHNSVSVAYGFNQALEMIQQLLKQER